MAFLVNSRGHGMVPFAQRLKNEGHKVALSISKKNYSHVWDGKAINYDEVANDTFEAVLSDVWEDSNTGLYGTYNTTEPTAQSYLRIGWWEGSEGAQYPHLLIYDLGAWPGNLGRLVGGGLTLVHLNGDEIIQEVETLLAKYQPEEGLGLGLIEADLVPDDDGNLALGNFNHGWNWLQAHAFVGPLENLGELLLGQTARFESGSKFVSVLPVSIPPWPEYGRKAATPEIQTEAHVRASTFWHDVVVDANAGVLVGGGTDGMLGVIRGTGNHPDLATSRAKEAAATLRIPEIQWRPDVGHQVTAVLNSIEKFYGVSPWR